MFTIKNALLYVKNHRDVSLETIRQQLSQHCGVSHVAPSSRSNGLIFIDYQPGTTSMTAISRHLGQSGMANYIVDM
jgi:hypothetical protein